MTEYEKLLAGERYNESDDNTIVFYQRKATATISSFTSDPETFTF